MRRDSEKKIEEFLGNLNVSERKEFLRKLRDSELVQNVFNNIREGIVIFDRSLEIRFANQSAKEILGIPENFSGQKIASYIKDFDWTGFLKNVRIGIERSYREEIEIDYPQRRVLLFYIIQQRQDKDSFIGIFHDLTDIYDKRKQEDEKARNDMISLLAAGVAHEIGNPLNSISLNLQVLEKKILSRKNKSKEELKLVQSARSEVSRLENILKKFLKAIRFQKANPVKTDVKKLIFETLSIMKAEIESKLINVNCVFDDAPTIILADEEQIKQAFYNIIKNAIQAMSEGGKLDIRCSSDNDWVEISFNDNGCGMNPEDLGKIFQPYFTTKQEGSGLGLMVVERIIHEHNGKISVESAPQMGTTFHIKLPLYSRMPKLLTGKEKQFLNSDGGAKL